MSNKGRIDEMYDFVSLEKQQQNAIALVEEFIAKVNSANQSKIDLKNATNPSDIISGIQKVTAAQKDQNDVVMQGVEVQKKMTKSVQDRQKADKSSADTITVVDKAKQKLAASESKLTKEAALYNVQASQQNKLNQINAQLLAAVPGSLEEAAAKVAKYRNEQSILNLTTEAGAKRNKELIVAIDEQNKFIDTNSDALARQKINIGNYESALRGLGTAVRGIGGLTRTLGSVLGIDPVVGETIHTVGKAVTELAHAYSLEHAASTLATGGTIDYTTAKVDETLTSTAATGTIKQHTVALEADEAATDAAAESTNAFTKALDFLKANPIVAVLVGIIAAITAVSLALGNQNEQFKKITAAAKAYADAVGAAIETTAESVDVTNEGLKNDVKYYENLLSKERQSGVTKERELAINQKILELNKQISDNQLKANPEIDAQLRSQIELHDKVLKKQQEGSKLLKAITEGNLTEAQRGSNVIESIFGSRATIVGGAELAKGLKENLDANNEVVKSTESNIKRLRGIKDDDAKVDQDLTENRLAVNRLNTEEQIKVTLEAAKLEVGAVQDKNSLILANEHSTNEERLQAIRDNAKAAQRLAFAEQQAIVNTPGVSDDDRINANADFAAKYNEIDRHLKADLVKEQEDYNKKILDLENELRTSQLSEAIDADKEILDSDKVTFDRKLEAAQQFYADSLTLLQQQRDAALKQADSLPDDGQRQKKKLAIEQKFNSDLLKLNRDSNKQIEDATVKHNTTIISGRKTAQEVELQSIQQDTDALLSAEDTRFAKALKRDLGNVFRLEQDRREHERRVLDIQDEGLTKQLQADIDFAAAELEIEKARVAAEPESDKKRADLAAISKAESDLSGLRKKLAAENASYQIKSDQSQEASDQDLYDRKIERLTKLKDYAQQGTQIIQGFVDAAAEREQNQIQDQIDLLDKKKEKDIEVANQTIANAADRANAITVIEARADAAKTLLETKRRQAQERQARFDKAANIAAIIEETALAVIRALGAKPYTPANIVLAAITGAIGAAQLAVAIATPIPKYKYGGVHKGGLAEVGHGRAEAVRLPTGQVFKTPATPTTMNLPKGTVIHPDWEKMMINATMTSAPEFSERAQSDSSAKVVAGLLSIEKTIKGKQENHWHMPGRYDTYMRSGSKFTAYLKDNL